MHLVFIHERRQCVRTRMSLLPLVRLFDLPSSLQYTHWSEDTDITIYTACNPSFGRQGSLDAFNIYNRECMLSSTVTPILVSIAILTKKGFAKRYDSISR